MDIAKNVTFAHVLLLNLMLKISIKFNIQICLVPYDRFLMGQVYQFHCLQEFWKLLKILSVRSQSHSQLTECSEYEYDNDQQPKPINQPC